MKSLENDESHLNPLFVLWLRWGWGSGAKMRNQTNVKQASAHNLFAYIYIYIQELNIQWMSFLSSHRFRNLIFLDVLRFQTMIFRNVLRFKDWCEITQHYPKISAIFQTYLRFNRIYWDFKIIQHVSGSQRFYWDSTMLAFRFLTIVKPHCFDTTKNMFDMRAPPHPPPSQKSRISNFQ